MNYRKMTKRSFSYNFFVKLSLKNVFLILIGLFLWSPNIPYMKSGINYVTNNFVIVRTRQPGGHFRDYVGYLHQTKSIHIDSGD